MKLHMMVLSLSLGVTALLCVFAFALLAFWQEDNQPTYNPISPLLTPPTNVTFYPVTFAPPVLPLSETLTAVAQTQTPTPSFVLTKASPRHSPTPDAPAESTSPPSPR